MCQGRFARCWRKILPPLLALLILLPLLPVCAVAAVLIRSDFESGTAAWGFASGGRRATWMSRASLQ
jgi:hypothetical protein